MPEVAQSRFAAPVDRSRQEGCSLLEKMLVTCQREGWFSPTSDSVCNELHYVPSPRPGHAHHVDLRRASVGHKKEVITPLARFVNFQLIEMLRMAAEQATAENLESVKLRHILPACEKWPWPLNRWC
jgi:hypothetical protein